MSEYFDIEIYIAGRLPRKKVEPFLGILQELDFKVDPEGRTGWEGEDLNFQEAVKPFSKHFFNPIIFPLKCSGSDHDDRFHSGLMRLLQKAGMHYVRYAKPENFEFCTAYWWEPGFLNEHQWTPVNWESKELFLGVEQIQSYGSIARIKQDFQSKIPALQTFQVV